MKILLVHNFYGSTAPSGENKVFEAEKAMLERPKGFVINKYVSQKLRVVTFLASLLVVVQHSYAQATFLQTCVTQSATRIAVPFFFVVSGMLLYREFDLSFEWAWNKIISRCRTLLVPYLTWSVLLTTTFFWGGLLTASMRA